MDYKKLKEEPLKSAVQQDFFNSYKYTQIGNIDFVIAKNIVERGQTSIFDEFENDDLKSLLWAEAKQGTQHDIFESFVQLILTIGKERTFEKYLPPKYIGAFDAEKFAFIEYHEIQGIFYQNDFNWNVTPSNHDTKEFRQLYALCKNLLEENSILFYFETQTVEFKEFIKLNFKTDKEATEKISVTKNNFTFVFQKWSDKVRPTISVDWAKANKAGIISADFFLADLLSSNEESLKDSLYVVLRKTKYELAKKIDEMGLVSTSSVGFNDKQKAYKQFWSIYARPPKEEYWNYIIGRRDLLVPQDIRERKGSYFTPQIWVEKSQQYLADVLGETWQDEYYIWDCCAGTGNLLNGLTNYDRVWASTLDKQDVDVMMDRIANGWKMAENHVFQFDFLNDDFSKCPEELQEILNDPEKRKKLVVYINPPYAEAANARTSSGTGTNRAGVAESVIRDKYGEELGRAVNELFAQFFARVVKEINSSVLAVFSKIKTLQGPNFVGFRNCFPAKLIRVFLMPANTFDNVSGQFPIGFQIWDTEKKEVFETICSDVFDAKGEKQECKQIFAYKNDKFIVDWIRQFYDKENERIAYLRFLGTDFQNNNGVFLTLKPSDNDLKQVKGNWVTRQNLLPMCIYFTVRHCIEATWLNDRDQFLYPNDGWKDDKEFQTDCLIFTLFHGQNRISCQVPATTNSQLSTVNYQLSTNHWIPFTREQVGCRKTFKSTFMADYLNGKIKTENSTGKLFDFQKDSVQYELPKMDHELSEIGIDENSCSIGGNSCEKKIQHELPKMNYELSEIGIGENSCERKTQHELPKMDHELSEIGIDENSCERKIQHELPKMDHELSEIGIDENSCERKTQHELPKMNHELSEIGINENSCIIHGNSCKGIYRFMSSEAQAVYDAGLALWRYYHSQPNALADASFYDIRLHFQGTNDKGTMNAKSDDETYTELISDLREKMKLLAKRIEPKVYLYGFLK